MKRSKNTWMIPYEDTTLPKGLEVLTPDQQKLVADALAETKKAGQVQAQKALDELNALKTKSTLTADERKSLEERLTVMQSEIATKEELARRDLEKTKREAELSQKTLVDERDAWKNRHINSMTNNEILSAAAGKEAYNPDQIVQILKPQIYIAEVTDSEGKPTGDLVPKVKYTGKGSDGKPTTLDVTVVEAVKLMSESEEHSNLFKSGDVDGVGRRVVRNGGSRSLTDLAKDPKAYREARSKGLV
jgi:hypothetical protein